MKVALQILFCFFFLNLIAEQSVGAEENAKPIQIVTSMPELLALPGNVMVVEIRKKRREPIDQLLAHLAKTHPGLRDLRLANLDYLENDELRSLTGFARLESLSVSGDVDLRRNPERLWPHVAKLKSLRSLKVGFP